MTRPKLFQVLLEKGLIMKRKTYICNECLVKYKRGINDWTSNNKINSNKNTNNGSYEDC